jgi:hypothetical protein
MKYDEILQAIISMAEAASGVSIVVGSLPPDGGIAMTGSAAPNSIMLDIGSNETMDIVCNGKHAEQQTVIGWLDAIHEDLTRRKRFPQGDDWQIYAIQTVASPRLLGREQNPQAQWVYGSSLLVKFNTKGINSL